MKLRLLMIPILCGSLLGERSAPANEPAPATIIMGIRSAEAFKADVRHTMELAERIETFESLVEPNIDIFLIGVDMKLPIRFDVVMDPENGQRSLLAVPLTNLLEFINNNLDPIGIIAKRDRQDRNFYQLTGGVLDGWMRIVNGKQTYAMLSTLAAKPIDVPATLSHPLPAIEPLVNSGYGLFAHFKNPHDGIERRTESFARYRNNIVDGVQKTPDESREAYELRKAFTAQQLDYLGRLFAQSEEATLGTRFDHTDDVFRGELHYSAIPETDLARAIDQLEKQTSYFAALAPAEKSVLTLRAHFPVDEVLQKEYRQLYELTRPVAAQHFDEDETLTQPQRDARKQIAELFLNVLSTSADLGTIDTFVNVASAGETHVILFGIRCRGQEEIEKLIDLIPAAKEGWSLERNVATEQGVAIHALKLGEKIPAALKDFYGASGVIYLGVGQEAFWISGGEGALDTLKGALNRLSEQTNPENDGTLLYLKMDTLPILENLNRLAEDGDLELLKKISTQQLFGGVTPAGNANAEQNTNGEPLRANAGALRGFEWQQATIDALKAEGANGLVELSMRRNASGTISGQAAAHNGVMRALGALIAKFADENFR